MTHQRQLKKLHFKAHRSTITITAALRAGIGVIALLVLGYGTTQLLKAEAFTSHPEIEQGIVRGNAAAVDSTGASGNQAVQFGLSAPGNVRAITGGNSIALIWDMAATGIARVEVYRNNAQVGTVTPGAGLLVSQKLGTRYIDKTVAAGTTYQYKVRTISLNGTPSPFSATVAATHPVNTTPVPNVTVDASQAPDLADYLNNYIVPEIQLWYPKLGDALAYPDYVPYPNIRIFTNTSYTGLAVASGWRSDGTITINPTWMRDHLEADGLFIHEVTHILQRYSQGPPFWLQEGLADWTREWLTRERYLIWTPRTTSKLTNGYSEGSYMLQWAETKYSPGIIRKLNIAARNGQYNDSILVQATGKTPEQLFTEAAQQHFSATGSIIGINGHCLSVSNNGTIQNTTLQIFPCDNSNSQKWMIIYRDAGNNGGTKRRFEIVNTSLAPGVERCLDVLDGGNTAQTSSCNRGATQEWTHGNNNSLVHTRTGKCLATNNGSGASGTIVTIATCNGSVSQRWTAPQ